MTIRQTIPAGAKARVLPSADDLAVTWHHPACEAGPIAARLAWTGSGEGRLSAERDGEPLAEARLSVNGEAGAALDGFRFRPGGPDRVALVAVLVEATFLRLPEARELVLPEPATLPAAAALTVTERAGRRVVARSLFRQLPLLWRRHASHASYPLIRSAIGPEDRLPPLRPPRPIGTFYARWLPELGATLSFRTVERERDLKLFHEWMNQPRVDFYWELAASEEEHDAYLARQEVDPHIFGVIGSFDDEPAAYFEFYWAKEDRLGPYYDAEDFDRGWHGLIGNKRHLGRAKTCAWFRSLTHYLFLDEPRTRRIVGEPRADHKRMLSYAAGTGYVKVKEFDCPHKRAALMCCDRERFFREVAL